MMKLSLKANFWILQIPFALCSIAVSITTWRALTLGTEEREVANRVNDLAQQSRLYVSEMGSALKGFILDPNNSAESEAKKQADEKNGQTLDEISKISHSSEVLKLVRELREVDDKNLNPAEDQVVALVKEGKNTEAREYFTKRYLPLRKLYDQLSSALAEKSRRETIESGSGRNLTEEMRHSAWVILLTLWIGQILTTILIQLSVSKLNFKLMSLADQLTTESASVHSAASDINRSSSELSKASSQQSSAIQETVSSVDQVSAMAKRSADNANASQELSQKSREKAEVGQLAVEEMIGAISAISESNLAITRQVESGNQRISEIAKVISAIADKTQVINEIVFQTRLLSFNASVEAARAGEHGKGFAVVAEEVGNLAAMSGGAAQEIAVMLSNSIQKVDEIVKETSAMVEKLVVESREKVEIGMKVADKCNATFKQLISAVLEVDGMVREISSAAGEQALGIGEINRAMIRLEQLTQENTGIAVRSEQSASQLNTQSQHLRSIVEYLSFVIRGDRLESRIDTSQDLKGGSTQKELSKRVA